MTRGDRLIEQGAHRLEETAVRFRGEDGWKAKLAEELAEDAAFLRKLKPSLIAARARGQAPPVAPAPEPELPAAPRPPKRKGGGGGPNPLVVVACALAVGIMLAKVIDWRSHAHPRG